MWENSRLIPVGVSEVSVWSDAATKEQESLAAFVQTLDSLKKCLFVYKIKS